MKFVGILEMQLPQRYRKIPVTMIQRFIILSFLTVAFVTSLWYSLFEAENIHDLMIESLYPTLGYGIALIMYPMLLWNRDGIVNFFHMIETKIQIRKLYS